MGQIDADHFGAELGVVLKLLARHQSGPDDFLIVVHVMDEPVQRCHPLDQSTLHGGPFMHRNDARNQVEGNQPLGAGLVAVHREGDAHAPEDEFRLVALRLHGVRRLLLQPPRVLGVVRAHPAPGRRHFIVKAHGRLSGGWQSVLTC
ncbi:hypothetical protein GALL_438700 [mine drainage metagenome]|uniref:Uncharacterized protein n=1 Tax=mine drainage metagenome TaxID=410659 RepID=A0A1J5PSA4_9ZZZZ